MCSAFVDYCMLTPVCAHFRFDIGAWPTSGYAVAKTNFYLVSNLLMNIFDQKFFFPLHTGCTKSFYKHDTKRKICILRFLAKLRIGCQRGCPQGLKGCEWVSDVFFAKHTAFLYFMLQGLKKLDFISIKHYVGCCNAHTNIQTPKHETQNKLHQIKISLLQVPRPLVLSHSACWVLNICWPRSSKLPAASSSNEQVMHKSSMSRLCFYQWIIYMHLNVLCGYIIPSARNSHERRINNKNVHYACRKQFGKDMEENKKTIPKTNLPPLSPGGVKFIHCKIIIRAPKSPLLFYFLEHSTYYHTIKLSSHMPRLLGSFDVLKRNELCCCYYSFS